MFIRPDLSCPAHVGSSPAACGNGYSRPTRRANHRGERAVAVGDVRGDRELYAQTGDNTAAVAGGLQRTGGLITSLAFLLIIVVGLFSASGVTILKPLGVGMIAALVVDASVVRVLLVPATMRLLGRANWWAPAPLRRFARQAGPLPAATPETRISYNRGRLAYPASRGDEASPRADGASGH